MGLTFKKRWETVTGEIKTKDTEEKARGDNKKAFTRKRKMPVCDIIISILTSRKQTCAMELRNFFKAKNQEQISKQAYFKARQNLNPEVFTYLNDKYLNNFYSCTDEVKTWNDYVVLAIDGSKVEIPNSKENREKYGALRNQHGTESPARAMISGLFDVYNKFFLDLQICNVRECELGAAERNLDAIGRIGIKQKVLVIFDRGYPSFELLYYLEKTGINYIIRLTAGKFNKERAMLKSDDEEISLEINRKRLERVKARNPELYEEMRSLKSINTRVVNEISPSGKGFSVLTNLPAKIRGEEICSAYFLRWRIEEAYHTLKNKMKFESVSGQASIYVEQDFLAQINVYNMMEDMIEYVEEQLLKTEEKKSKYHQHLNENMAIGLFAQDFIKILIESNKRRKNRLIKTLENEMKKYLLPKRDSISKKRRFRDANKYSANQKSSF